MSLAAASAVLNVAGSIFGGQAERKAAKRKAAFQRSQVIRQRDYGLEDNRLSSNALQSQIMASAGASGVRTSSGSVQSVKSDEMLKSGRRRERILAGSEAELKMIAMNLKSEKSAANIDMISGIANAGTSYFGGSSG